MRLRRVRIAVMNRDMFENSVSTASRWILTFFGAAVLTWWLGVAFCCALIGCLIWDTLRHHRKSEHNQDDEALRQKESDDDHKRHRWQFSMRDAGISATGICVSLPLIPDAFSGWLLLGGSAGYFIGRAAAGLRFPKWSTAEWMFLHIVFAFLLAIVFMPAVQSKSRLNTAKTANAPSTASAGGSLPRNGP